MNRFIAFAIFVLALAIAPSARAYTPPTMTAHVTDTAHKLTETERLAIDRKLEDYRVRTGNQIAVFVPASLDGEAIADVATDTGRAWKIGVKGVDNGVLLVVAPVERKAWVATGKGTEGSLTDLQANDIVRLKMRPHLIPGHEDYRAAIDDATDAIMAALDAGGTKSAPVKKTATAGDALFGIVFLLIMLGIPIIFMIVIVRALTRAFSSNGRSASAGWASGSSWSNDSSWSSGGGGGGSDWGGGGGDSGFSGGGGDFGGGGGGDSF